MPLPRLPNRHLIYRQPAETWLQALPLGNGRLGAMVYGGVATDRFQLNEDSLWYGGPRDRVNPDALGHLEQIQTHLREGRIPEAEALSVLALSGVPEHPSHYVPVGELVMAWDGEESSDYHRELDLSQAVCGTRYRAGTTQFFREALVSAVDQVVAIRVTADAEGALACRIRLVRGRYTGALSHPSDTSLLLEGGPEGPGGVSFAAMVRAEVEGGRCYAVGEFLVLEAVTSVTLLVAVATSYRHADPSLACATTLDRALLWGWDDLRRRHVADYRRLADRMDIDLAVPPVAERATDERLAQVAAGGHDHGLVELYFRYGRYLLISSSRPGTLPSNLQGLWNDHFLPPWGSKFTININTQMNYWPAEPANLGECHLPLLELLERMVPRGRRVAQVMYGCRGFVAHHNTDLWGDCAPVDHWVPASLWPLGAAWLCLHLWEHWEHSGDREFLDRAYAVMAEAATFFLDFLTEAPDGRLVTNPSVSPENTYILPSGVRGSLCFGPSMDSQILYALFTACHDAAGILGRDADLAREFLRARDRLPKPAVGGVGQLLEWPLDYEEAEPGHRHVSHLFALHPGDQITLRATPDLARACRTTLERRLAQGGGHTGWSKAWIINLWARLGEGDQAWDNLEDLLGTSTAPNLFDLHPPGVFQIDGNFGAVAGILELLVQSLGGVIWLLPALPSSLPLGAVRGLRAKGGFEVDLTWDQGRLVAGELRSHRGLACRLGSSHPLVVRGEDGAVLGSTTGGILPVSTTTGGRYLLGRE